jgi:hypothetical protein
MATTSGSPPVSLGKVAAASCAGTTIEFYDFFMVCVSLLSETRDRELEHERSEAGVPSRH